MENELEEWRPVPNLRLTEASSLGRIRRDGKIKRALSRPRNYQAVSLYKRLYFIHRLVCMAFYGLPTGNKIEAMHLDSDPTNNRVENLKWGTHAENMAMDRGNNHSHRGEINPNVKLTPEAVREIRAAYDQRTNSRWGRTNLSLKFGISEQQCFRIATRETGGWKHLD